jgi:EAL domain-containing protein (putative c-di-GMP-specific phosphodiesterase class I)
MMLELFSTLRLPVVSEGIEENDQAAVLRLLRCAMGQGYLFARPAPIEAFLQSPSLAAAAAA